MVQLYAQINHAPDLKGWNTPAAGEVIAALNITQEAIRLLQEQFHSSSTAIIVANDEDELWTTLDQHRVALLLLDIKDCGVRGKELLATTAGKYPDIGIIIVTESADIQTALHCLRCGADDYLTRPFSPSIFNHTVNRALNKRRLALQNKKIQKELQNTNSRMQFLHDLTLKMNSAYLNAPELNNVLYAILTGITSADGLRFNRAFLALFDEEGSELSGRLAIGPASREEAGHVWQEITEKRLSLSDLLHNIETNILPQSGPLTSALRNLRVPESDSENILIRACREKKSSHITWNNNDEIPEMLRTELQLYDFVLAPLFSASKSLGVILADNYITGAPISEDDITALEIFANQASLAIEHSHLYRDMETKIEELERANEELDKNKNLLVEAERYATIGYISAQLVHAIRNPITAIGGTARRLQRKTQHNSEDSRYFNILIQESEKIEETLNNIFSYVNNVTLEKENVSLAALLRKSIAPFLPTLKKHQITIRHNLDRDIFLVVDYQKIQQVFFHLLRNSIDAMPSGGELSVQLQQNAKETTVRIEDSGPGISTDDINIATDPFYTTKTYGTGLGLALVKQIMDLHQASFSLEKLEPSGTRVTLFFPNADPVEQA